MKTFPSLSVFGLPIEGKAACVPAPEGQRAGPLVVDEGLKHIPERISAFPWLDGDEQLGHRFQALYPINIKPIASESEHLSASI